MWVSRRQVVADVSFDWENVQHAELIATGPDRVHAQMPAPVLGDPRRTVVVEVTTSDDRLTPALSYFQEASGADHAFSAVIDREYVPVDCFSRKDPVVVPARTLLSQLL